MTVQPFLTEPSLANAIGLIQASDLEKSKISHWCCSIRAVAGASASSRKWRPAGRPFTIGLSTT